MRPRLAGVPSSAVLAAALAVVLVGCSSSASTAPSAAAPTVSDAWARPAVQGGTGAAYMTISNPGGSADTLLSASSPAAASVELHRTMTDASGMTGMSPIDRLEIPAGGSVSLAPGGYHLMMMGLSAPLEAGSTVEIELVFEHAGKVVVQAEVRQG